MIPFPYSRALLTRRRISGAANDPNFANVSLLLHLNGTNGSTTFTDSSGTPKTVLGNNNAQISTAQSKYGGASAIFDGTSDFIYCSGTAPSDLVFGTGDFTVEFWLYRNSSQVNPISVLFDTRPNTTQGIYPTIYVDNGVIKFFTNSSDRITGSSLSSSTWLHIALCRSSGTTRLFVGGTQVGSNYTDSNNYICGLNRPIFAASGFDGTTLEHTGYIDDIRITKGVARYTANFTPPTAQFPDS